MTEIGRDRILEERSDEKADPKEWLPLNKARGANTLNIIQIEYQ